MDSVLDAVASNQETHLKQLQHMQQWSVSRLVNRVVNAKYFYRQSNVAPCAAFEEIFPSTVVPAPTASPAATATAATGERTRRPSPGGKLQASTPRGGYISASSTTPGGLQTEETLPAAAAPSSPRPQERQQPLPQAVQQQHQARHGSLLPPFIPREAVGRLHIEVPGACLLLFSAEGVRSSPILLQRERHQQQLTWLLRVLVENQQQQSRSVRLNTRGGGEAGSSSSSSNCVNELPFAASFDFPVRDLWTDVSLEIICIRPCRHIIMKATKEAAATSGGATTTSSSSANAPLEDVSGVSAAAAAGRLPPQQQRDILTQQLLHQYSNASDDSSVCFSRTQQQQQQQQQQQGATGGPSLASTDLAPSDALPSLDERQLYGRAIVPLSSFLRAVSPVQQQQQEQPQQQGVLGLWSGGGLWVSEGEFWAHLYPDNKKQQERKYLRPIRGTTERQRETRQHEGIAPETDTATAKMHPRPFSLSVYIYLRMYICISNYV